MHNDFIWMFLFKNWNSFRFLNKRGLFKRASEVWKKNQKALLTQRHLKHFCKKNLSLGWTAHIFLHIFSPNCSRYQYLLLLFSNQKFYEQEITKCIIVQETITYLSPLYPSKNNTQTRSLYSFFVPPKSKFLPWELFSKNGVLSYFIASIDLELFTTSPKPPIFNLSNIKSIIKINFLPHLIFLRN